MTKRIIILFVITFFSIDILYAQVTWDKNILTFPATKKTDIVYDYPTEIDNEAIKYYNKAINVNPSFKEARVNLSAILFNEKKYFEALSTILQSKVEVYWKRQRNNDTYDLYLKTIFNSYINDIQPKLNENEFLLLQDLLNYFNHQPAAAERKLRMVYNKSINLNLDFISTLKITSKN